MQPVTQNRLPGIFRATPDVIKASDTLLRLTTLDSTVPKFGRMKMFGRVNEFCITAQEKNLVSVEDAKKHLQSELPGCVLDVYKQEIDMATTTDEVSNCINKLMKDISSVAASPLKKSTGGQNGPTLLVAYPRMNKKSSEPEMKCYVIKWTDQNELCCNKIYGAFSRFISESCNATSFAVPNVCGFDFESNTHEMFDASLSKMQAAESQKVLHTFKQITKIAASNQLMPNKLVMLSERVNGENLCDFAMFKYKLLTQPQKAKLFVQLGQIAMLDLIIGNSDRLVPISRPKENEPYSLLGCEANLGNIMVRWTAEDETSPLIYAIDNAVESELIDDPISIKKHQVFLQSLFSSPEMENTVVNNIAASLLIAISNHVAETPPSKKQEFKNELQAISKDIHEFGKDCFRTGLNEMSSMLRSTLIPMWNGEQGSPSRNYLSTTYPKLLDAIQSRFNEFITKRTL